MTGLVINAELTARAGDCFGVDVAVHIRPGLLEAGDRPRIYPRLSTLGQYDLQPAAEVSVDPDKDADALMRYTFDLPKDLRPHRFFIKVLAVTCHEVAFGCRAFFVV